MFRDTLKFSLRVFKREKLFTSINIGGLVLGFYTCAFILGYVMFEFSYEDHITNSEKVFRINTTKFKNDRVVYNGVLGPSIVGQIVPKLLPNINFAARVYNEIGLISTNEKKLATQKISWVDKDIFKVFEGILISGNPETVLDAPLKAVITESKAIELFGNVNPIGKTFEINEGIPFLVTGVVKTPPLNTHFKYDFICSLSTFVKYKWIGKVGSWDSSLSFTYALLEDSKLYEQTEEELNKLALIHVNPKENRGKKLEFELQNIQKIHLSSNLSDEPEINGDFNQLQIVIGVGVILLLIVFVNYVNLSTALSLKRTKDTGIRKIFGAKKNQLKLQYFIEAFLLNTTALLIAVVFVFLTSSLLENFFEVQFSFSVLYTLKFWLWFSPFFIGTIFLVGFYPAFMLSSMHIITAIKGEITNDKSNGLIKKILLTGQFIASIFLIVGAIVVFQQVEYMRNYDLGIDTERILVIEGPSSLNSARRDQKERNFKLKKFRLFKEHLLSNSLIKNVASSVVLPGDDSKWKLNSVSLVKTAEEFQTKMERRFIDQNFFPMYGVSFLSGTNFEHNESLEKNEIVINDKARKLLGFINPNQALGEFVKMNNGKPYRIIGVVKDFHIKSLSETISPIFFENIHPWEFGYYLVKLDGQNISEQIDFIEQKWKEIYLKDPFITQFSEDYFNKHYKNNEQFHAIFSVLTLLAILIANLGLVAMISLATTEKLKEIGIRRVLGASNKSVFILMSTDFLKIIAIAILVAFPLSWWLLTSWLQSFAYRIELSVITILTAIFIILCIALSNISYFVIKVLRCSPTDIIREE